MKIEYYSACTSSGINVDGVDFDDLPKEKRKEILYKLCDRMVEDDINPHELDYMFSCVCEIIGEEYADVPCDQCGHTWESRTYELE